MANGRIRIEDDAPRKGGRLLFFFLGLLFGIIIVVGSLVGVVYYAYKSPVKKTVKWIDKDGSIYDVLFNTNSGYLNPKYADEQVGVLLGDALAAFASVGQGGPMRDVQEVSPLFSGLFTNLLNTLTEYEVPVTEDGLLDQSLNGIFPYIVDSLGETPVGGFLKGSSGENITDPLMLAICYGSESHYTLDENGNVVMNPVTYEYKDGQFYDVDGEPVTGAYDPTAKTLTIDGATYYLEANADPSNVYTAYLDGAKTQPLLHKKTLMSDLSNGDELIDHVRLCDALGLYKADEKASPILLSIAYGEEGIDYTVAEDKTIIPISKPRTIADLKGNSNDVINSVTLKDALNITPSSHNIMKALAFGRYKEVDGKVVADTENGGSVKTLGDLINNSDELINDVRLIDAMYVDTNSKLMMYVLYGREGVHYSLDSEGTPVCLQRRVVVCEGLVYNEYGERLENYTFDGSALTITDGSDAENPIAYTATAGTGENATYTWKVKQTTGEVTTVEEKTGTVYFLSNADGAVYYEPSTLGDLTSEDNAISNVTTRLTVSELVDGAEDNRFLKHLNDTTIDLLPYSIEQLTLTQVYGDQIYFTDANGNYTDGEDGAIVDEAHKVIRPAWWYLLHDETVCEAGREDVNSPHYGHTAVCDCIEDYTVNDMNRLIENMNANINIVTLGKLKSDGMIETDVALDTTLVTYNGLTEEQIATLTAKNIANGTPLENLTVDQAMTYISIVITTLNAIIP